jgi:hypothetical protein
VSILLRILALLFPFAADPDTPDPIVDDPADELDIEAADDTPEPEVEDKPDPVEARVTAAETAAREAQEQIQALRRQASQRPDPTLDEEERKLRDPNTSELEKWQINSNRALRSSAQASQQALFQAQDMADRTTYQSKSVANPIYSKYESKVEAELKTARQNGQNPSRELILAVLIGRDQLAGNFKPAASAGKPIARGKPVGARSDTPSRGTASEREKRIARLANIQI